MDHLEHLIVDLKESLERQILGVESSLRQEMREGFARIETKFDTQAARLDRQAGLLQTGNRWIARTNDWTEKIDKALETKDREIDELRARLDKLEKRNGKSGPGTQSTQ
jgi:predicted RNase H-like nuclease (RuvC/YqgF family)